MRKRPTENEEESLSISFLDVLCCGLGATIYLFLLFSIMPHLGSGGRQDAEKSAAGAKASAGALADEGERVLFAPVLIQVFFPKGMKVQAADLEWEGLPADRTTTSVVAPSGANRCVAVAIAPEGMNPKKHGGAGKIYPQLKPGVLQKHHQGDLLVLAHVGGGRQEKELALPKPVEGDTPVRLVEIDFFNPSKLWIHPAPK